MKSEIAKAINYGLSRWEAFTRFLSDGLICLSNNRDERALRGVTPGRANWTFAGSDAGGHRAAAVYTTSVVILLWKWYYMGYYNSARTHLSQGYAAAAACLGHRTHSSELQFSADYTITTFGFDFRQGQGHGASDFRTVAG